MERGDPRRARKNRFGEGDRPRRNQSRRPGCRDTAKARNGGYCLSPLPFAKTLRTSPVAIAQTVAAALETRTDLEGTIQLAGAYLNVAVSLTSTAAELFAATAALPETYGHSDALSGTSIMVEFSCPNTNKPLHLGHLRNDAVGESVSRILAAAGAAVRKVNLINDRGIHICKSMLAYQKFGEGRTPEEVGKKSDHFVGDYYVKFNQWAKENPTTEAEARDLLLAWERGDAEVTRLWEQMNRWAIDGIEETLPYHGHQLRPDLLRE